MEETRFALCHAASYADGVSLRGDVQGAFPTSDIGGPAKWMRIRGAMRADPRVIPRNKQHVKRPVARVRKALYGFKRAGADYGAHLKKKMRQLKVGGLRARKLRDVVASVWIIGDHMTGIVVIIVYVDDVSPNGPRKLAVFVYNELDLFLGFSEKSKENPELTKFVGMVRFPFVDREDGGTRSHPEHDAIL